jgi:hypothetical protein
MTPGFNAPGQKTRFEDDHGGHRCLTHGCCCYM